MRTSLFISSLTVMLLTHNSYSQDGAAIFKKNCAVCHSIGKGKLVGPDLKGVDKKYDIEWLIPWIKSSQTMVKKKDARAIQIFNDNNHLVMTDQALSDDEIKTLLAFIGEETIKREQAAISPAPAQTSIQTPGLSQSTSDVSTTIPLRNIIYILLALIAFLTLIIIVLSNVIRGITDSYKK